MKKKHSTGKQGGAGGLLGCTTVAEEEQAAVKLRMECCRGC